MKLTIETGSVNEVNELLHIFKTLNLRDIRIVLETSDRSVSVGTDSLNIIHRPLKKRLDIDALKKERNYKGVNRKRFDALVKEINIIEPVDMLIAQLSR